METPLLAAGLFAAIAVAVFGFVSGRQRALVVAADSSVRLHSRPQQHGLYVVFWVLGPALVALALFGVFAELAAGAAAASQVQPALIGLEGFERDAVLDEVRRLARGTENAATSDAIVIEAAAAYEAAHQRWRMAGALLALAGAAGGFVFARRRISPAFRARERVERVIYFALLACSVVAIVTTFGIVASLLGESLRFFFKLPPDWWRIWAWETRVPPHEFFFGLQWSPQTAVREDQVGQSGAFGLVPLLYGTLYITVIAMLVAVPVGLYSAIYLSEYAGPGVRAWFKPILEILAGVPTVVYGFFALLTVGPAIRAAANAVGLDAPTQSALAAGVVMGVMIIPFVSSLSDDVINAVPQSLRDGALALGATHAEMVRQVVLPAALPGVMAAILLAISRAVGETMIVVMAAGQAAKISPNPLESLTTITVQLTKFFTGDQDFTGAKTLSAFALGLVLFVLTLAMNAFALYIVRRYREKYE